MKKMKMKMEDIIVARTCLESVIEKLIKYRNGGYDTSVITETIKDLRYIQDFLGDELIKHSTINKK